MILCPQYCETGSRFFAIGLLLFVDLSDLLSSSRDSSLVTWSSNMATHFNAWVRRTLMGMI